MKKICVVTGSRAEYGLLQWVMKGIKHSTTLKLQLIVTGSHLYKKYGYTKDIIETDGFKIDKKIYINLGTDTSLGITRSISKGLLGFSKALNNLKPDLLMVLGDRYEIFTAVVASMNANIPIAHLHGGESTEGMADEAIRHSITKMSHLHFVAAEEYKNRIIQMGEHPSKVYKVGGLGLDSIKKLKFLSKAKIEKKINFKFLKKNLLITYHPVTLESNSSGVQIDEILKALSTLNNTGLIFTMPNADKNNKIIFSKIKKFCQINRNAKYYNSLGQLVYLSCLKYVNGVVGNSSSGLLEVPSFKIGTINIGDRQKGRLEAKSVINCKPRYKHILKALNHLYSNKFQSKLPYTKNLYGKSGASKKIIEILEKSLDTINLKKKFNNLKV